MKAAQRLRHRAQGFTYIGLLFVVALIGVALALAGETWSVRVKREREAELLFAGDQLRRALDSYRAATPGRAQFPQSLDELLEDKRFPTIRRHLRRIYIDPMTGRPEWGLVKAGERIIGVHSLSTDAPLKRSNFSARDTNFAGAKEYRDWRFVVEQSAPPPPQLRQGSAPARTDMPSVFSAPPGGAPSSSAPSAPPTSAPVETTPRRAM